MKKTPSLVVAVLLALGLVLAGCSSPVGDASSTSRAAAPVYSQIMWKAGDAAVATAMVAWEVSKRTNASGPKIPSNAHSADFPGVYFYWDSKQKSDDCYLKVQPWVFEKYVYFILTTKESNVYTDFTIMPIAGQKLSADGCFVFKIPKVVPKNINMVFIPEFKVLKGPDDPPYVWTDPIPPEEIAPCVYRYVVMSVPGTLEFALPFGVPAVEVQDNLAVFNGDLKAYWDSQMNQADLAALRGIKEFADGTGRSATWIWDINYTAENYGVTGAQTIVFAQMLPVIGKIQETYIPFYFACDNAAAVYVNGQRVGFTEWAFEPYEYNGVQYNPAEPGLTYDWRFNGFGADSFDGSRWQKIYVSDVAGKLKTGANTIIIVAANSDTNGGRWDETNNPAGLLFSCEWTSKK